MSLLGKLTKAANIILSSHDNERPAAEAEETPRAELYLDMPFDGIIDEDTYDEYLNSSPPAIVRRDYIFDNLKFGDFPSIEEGKIKNADNLIKVKEKYVRQAFEAVRSYYDYILHLPPISMNEEYAKCILHIITRLIAVYWDMPASKNHHDSGDFGLLRHAVHTGTREASRLCRLNRYSSISGVDSESTRKTRPKVVISGFIVGMLHDADKMLQIKLTCDMLSGVNEFNPLHGSGAVLDFKLKYPRDKMKLEWVHNEHKSLNMGLHYLYSPVVPAVFRKSLDGEILEFIFTCMKNYKSKADQIAAQFSQAQDAYLNEIRVGLTRMLAVEAPVNDLDGALFKLCNNWYMAIQDKFIATLNTEVRATENAVERVLVEYGVLKTRGKNDFNGHRFSLNLMFPGARYEKKFVVSFYQASFIDTLPIFNNARIGLAPIKICAPQADLLRRAGIDLPAYAFTGNSKDSAKNKGSAGEEAADEPTAAAHTVPGANKTSQNSAESIFEAVMDSDPSNANNAPERLERTLQTASLQTQSHSVSGTGKNIPLGPAPAQAAQARQAAPKAGGQSTNNSRPVGKQEKKQPEPSATRKDFETQAMLDIKGKSDELKPIPYLPASRMRTYQERFTPAMCNALPCLDVTLAESLANGVGTTALNSVNFPAMHLQATNSPKTIFYILDNNTMLSRHPGAVKFAWGVMMHRRQGGKYGWLKDIPDLPVLLGSAEQSSKLLISYIYLAWARKGLLIPEANQPVFRLSDHLVPIMKKKGKDPLIVSEKISGEFISLDLIALLGCETDRIGNRSLEQVIRYHYKFLYDAEW